MVESTLTRVLSISSLRAASVVNASSSAWKTPAWRHRMKRL